MLKPQICVIQVGCGVAYVFDKTGAYDAINNPGGYGAPNPELADVESAVIAVLYAGATVYSPDIDVYPLLPTLDDEAAYQILPAALGLTTYPSGLTRFTFTVRGHNSNDSGAEFGATATALVLFDCEYKCCVDKKFAALATDNSACNCNCENSKVMDALYLEATLIGAQKGTCCGNVDAVNKNLAILKTKCVACGCGGS